MNRNSRSSAGTRAAPVAFVCSLVLSCGAEDFADDNNTGGSPSAGGTTHSQASGGATGATGGTPASGGALPSGGQVSTGGTPLTGGNSSTGGHKSSGGTFGSATGGGSPAGGGPMGGVSSGGAETGGTSTGGMTGSDADLCDAGVWDGAPPSNLTLSGNTFAHDPTMVKVDDVYYRFWTGDYIPVATSTNLTHWEDAPPVYGTTYPEWSDQWLAGVSGETFNFPWAPDVSLFGDEVHLYSSFSAKFGDNISCITHLSTNDIAAGAWTDHGPVICTQGNENHNAIDADVALDENGTPWLSFGSFWDGIMAFELNVDGSRKGQELTRLAWANQIEAPVIFRRCGYYYLFVTWGLCCPGEGRAVSDLTYRVAVGRSPDILGPYVDRNGTALTEGGGTLLVEGDGVTWAAAGHSDVVVDGQAIYHFYHAYRQSNGAASLRISELFFDNEGWPVPHAP